MQQLRSYRRVYLATPYTKYKDGIYAAWKEAAVLTAKLLSRGVNTYSPIVHSHPIAVLGKLNPLDHKIWLPLNECQLEDADALVVATLDGWRESYGVGVEIEFFNERNKPIHYFCPLTLQVTDEPVEDPLAASNHRTLTPIEEFIHTSQRSPLEEMGIAHD